MKNFLIILSIFLLLQVVKGCINSSNYNNSTTNANQSRYNTMSPSDYYKEMKSENLQYSDVAWQAKNTYGWNCDEITNMSNPISTNGSELKDSYLISQIQGNYSIATCTSGVRLRVYPRYNTYPIITNINGGFE